MSDRVDGDEGSSRRGARREWRRSFREARLEELSGRRDADGRLRHVSEAADEARLSSELRAVRDSRLPSEPPTPRRSRQPSAAGDSASVSVSVPSTPTQTRAGLATAATPGRTPRSAMKRPSAAHSGAATPGSVRRAEIDGSKYPMAYLATPKRRTFSQTEPIRTRGAYPTLEELLREQSQLDAAAAPDGSDGGGAAAPADASPDAKKARRATTVATGHGGSKPVDRDSGAAVVPATPGRKSVRFGAVAAAHEGEGDLAALPVPPTRWLHAPDDPVRPAPSETAAPAAPGTPGTPLHTPQRERLAAGMVTPGSGRRATLSPARAYRLGTARSTPLPVRAKKASHLPQALALDRELAPNRAAVVQARGQRKSRLATVRDQELLSSPSLLSVDSSVSASRDSASGSRQSSARADSSLPEPSVDAGDNRRATVLGVPGERPPAAVAAAAAAAAVAAEHPLDRPQTAEGAAAARGGKPRRRTDLARVATVRSQELAGSPAGLLSRSEAASSAATPKSTSAEATARPSITSDLVNSLDKLQLQSPQAPRDAGTDARMLDDDSFIMTVNARFKDLDDASLSEPPSPSVSELSAVMPPAGPPPDPGRSSFVPLSPSADRSSAVPTDVSMPTPTGHIFPLAADTAGAASMVADDADDSDGPSINVSLASFSSQIAMMSPIKPRASVQQEVDRRSSVRSAAGAQPRAAPEEPGVFAAEDDLPGMAEVKRRDEEIRHSVERRSTSRDARTAPPAAPRKSKSVSFARDSMGGSGSESDQGFPAYTGGVPGDDYDEDSAEETGYDDLGNDSESSENEDDEDDDVDEDEDDEESEFSSSPDSRRGRKARRRSQSYAEAVVGRGQPTPVHEAYARAATVPPTPLTPSLQRLKGYAARRRTSIVFPTVQRQPRRPLHRKASARVSVPAHLKQSALKAIARTVTDMPIRVEALGVLAHQCQELMDSFVTALETVAEQNHRRTIELPDVEFLLHETSLITPRQSLTDTMRKELPEELVERMIPIARAQNVVAPKPHVPALAPTHSYSSSSRRRK